MPALRWAPADSPFPACAFLLSIVAPRSIAVRAKSSTEMRSHYVGALEYSYSDAPFDVGEDRSAKRRDREQNAHWSHSRQLAYPVCDGAYRHPTHRTPVSRMAIVGER